MPVARMIGPDDLLDMGRHMVVADNDENQGDQARDEDAGDPDPATEAMLFDESGDTFGDEGLPRPGGDFTEDERADPDGVIAGTNREHQQKFRWWALGVIAGLCVFFALATLLFATLASGEAATQVASDMAKTAIPTLLTLLGTAVAWAFKSERD